MKVCPVCNESFGNDLNFCDVDGTKLQRERGAASEPESSKAWSLLGVGLLLGAVIISAASILFFPKARISPTAANSGVSTAPEASQPAQPTATEMASAATSEYPEVVVEETPAPESKKKEKAQTLTEENMNAPAPNPKAAVLEGEEKAEDSHAAPPAAPVKTEPQPSIKTVSEARENDAAAKAADSNAELKKDSKQPSKSSKDSDKSNGKKDDEKKEKKKKGGLFGVFKKIFGKD